MDSQHRKIELQSPSDLTFLTTQLRTAARQKLNLHLPPVSHSPSPDELRHQVEQLIDAFIGQVLAGMRSNISINGIEVEGCVASRGAEKEEEEGVHNCSVGEEYEAFDERVRERVAAAITRRDDLVGRISAHRRTTAARAATAFQLRFLTDCEDLALALPLPHDAHHLGRVAGVGALERRDDVARNWHRALEGLHRLNKGLPETRARLERARDVLGYLEEKA